MGFFSGHALDCNGGVIEAKTGVQVGFFDFASTNSLPIPIVGSISLPEFLLIPGLILLAVFVGFIPATSAYKTDVSKSLGK